MCTEIEVKYTYLCTYLLNFQIFLFATIPLSLILNPSFSLSHSLITLLSPSNSSYLHSASFFLSSPSSHSLPSFLSPSSPLGQALKKHENTFSQSNDKNHTRLTNEHTNHQVKTKQNKQKTKRKKAVDFRLIACPKVAS